MIEEKKIMSHPSVSCANDLIEICRPLEKLYGIDYFSHVNVDRDGYVSGVGKNPEFAEHYLKSGYHSCDSHLSKIDNDIEFIIQDSVHHYGKTEKLFIDCKNFGLHHIFTILHRETDSISAYHFATSKIDNRINELYLKNLPLLQNFISYFKEQMNSNKNLMGSYNIKFRTDGNAAYESDTLYLKQPSNIEEFLHSIKIKRHYLLDNKNNYITAREFECLMWLHFGKTAEEMASILKITERTVRAHINSIKDKLGCRTLFQLGEKISQLNLIKLIDLYNKLK
jgi:DNA-binding CsgD family transcriptional regulator